MKSLINKFSNEKICFYILFEVGDLKRRTITAW